MAQRLDKRASGTRHFQWGTEVHATLSAHLEFNDTLSDTQRTALETEQALLEARLAALEASNAPYQTFLSSAYTHIRARQRVADYLCDEAMNDAQAQFRRHRNEINTIFPGGYARIFSGLPLSRILRAGTAATVTFTRNAAEIISSLPDRFPRREETATRLNTVADLLDGFNTERTEQIDPQRAPLKLAVERDVFELREALAQIDGRLRTHFPAVFIESLYPALARNRRSVADEDNGDTDA